MFFQELSALCFMLHSKAFIITVYVHAVLEKKSLTDDAENEALEKHGSLQ
jgi:hypothetical protein